MTAARPPRYAVIGNPVAHSKSPRIHALFAQQTGKALEYGLLPAELDGFAQVVRTFFAQGGAGLNVTVPFKEQAHTLADVLSARAKAAGAVNTLWMQDGRLHGCNTDGVGLVGDLVRLGVRLSGARVLMVGAGGAARGVLQPLIDAGCTLLRIVNRNASRAHELAAAWQGVAPVQAGGLADAAVDGGWDVVINATSTGLAGQAPQLPSGLYAAGGVAYDMMYGPKPTPFLVQARADGAALCADGLGMLVGQAAESFRIWHGVRPDPEPVLQRLRAELSAAA
jgi:shikimate 5-dehydrogenase